jgi:leader peptidase (prepilin peptidase)/N-methyltransferase
MIFSWIALFCLAGAVFLLAALSVVDLKTRLLPNEMVLGFALLGLVFHWATAARFVAPEDIVLGGVFGFGSLFILRAVANHLCKMDTLGLGDVKLMGAAGLWLGPQAVMIAMAAGACCSLLHGLVLGVIEARRTHSPLNLNRLSLPAGPGFACGIVIAGWVQFQDFRPDLFWHHAMSAA